MPLKHSSKNVAKPKKMAHGGVAHKTSKGVQGPSMIVKKKDGNRPVKIY
jgi:hypothetical protein